MASRPFRLSAPLAVGVVVVLTCLAYSNSFEGEFVMDDQSEIEENPAMRTLLPPWRAMFVGNRMPARPLPYLTFAIDHALWGDDPFGYHLTNLAIHVGAALALFGLVRRSLLSPRLEGRYADRATLLALIIAATWAVHPLQTQAVTYVYQRIESLTGMLSLVALYAFARASGAGYDRRWLAVCTVSTAAAMASKESAVVLPLLIASYDWLLCGTGPTGFRTRRAFYAGLASTWIILAVVLASQAGRYGEFQEPVHRPLPYLLTQPRVILHYLRLATIPSPLCFDYVWRTAETVGEFLPSLCWLLVPFVATIVAAPRARPAAWLGIVFFFALAPTSSIMPVVALAAEHRMYLPLAAFVAAVVLACDLLVRRWPKGERLDRVAAGIAVAAACCWIATLSTMTHARNAVYAMPGGIWQDVLSKQLPSTRALWNLARTCARYDRIDDALGYADELAGMNPRLAIFRDLAEYRHDSGQRDQAVRILRHGLSTLEGRLAANEPVRLETAGYLAAYLHEDGSTAEAVAVIEQALADAEPLPASLEQRRAIADMRGLLARITASSGGR